MSTKKANLPQKDEIKDAQNTSIALQASIDRLARSMAVLAVYSSPYKDKPDIQRIPFLAALGFEKDDIAAILATTLGTVKKQLSLSRTGKRIKKTSKPKVKNNAKNQPKAS